MSSVTTSIGKFKITPTELVRVYSCDPEMNVASLYLNIIPTKESQIEEIEVDVYLVPDKNVVTPSPEHLVYQRLPLKHGLGKPGPSAITVGPNQSVLVHLVKGDEAYIRASALEEVNENIIRSGLLGTLKGSLNDYPAEVYENDQEGSIFTRGTLCVFNKSGKNRVEIEVSIAKQREHDFIQHLVIEALANEPVYVENITVFPKEILKIKGNGVVSYNFIGRDYRKPHYEKVSGLVDAYRSFVVGNGVIPYFDTDSGVSEASMYVMVRDSLNRPISNLKITDFRAYILNKGNPKANVRKAKEVANGDYLISFHPDEETLGWVEATVSVKDTLVKNSAVFLFQKFTKPGTEENEVPSPPGEVEDPNKPEGEVEEPETETPEVPENPEEENPPHVPEEEDGESDLPIPETVVLKPKKKD